MSIVLMHQFEAEAARARAWAKAWKRAAKHLYKAVSLDNAVLRTENAALKDTVAYANKAGMRWSAENAALKAKIEALPAVIRDLCGGHDVQPWFMEQVKKALGEHFGEGK